MAVTLEVYCFIGLLGFATGSPFLGRLSANTAPGLFPAEFDRALLSEIESVLGNEHRNFTEKRLGRIEDALRATYAAVPKNEHGFLGHAAASYALHRLFVQRHGWSVRGLDPSGKSMAAWNTSNATVLFEDRVPVDILKLFEKRLGGRGFSLRELAVLAATLEHLVHQEALKRLQEAFRGNGIAIDDAVSDLETEQILDSYMAIYIMESTERRAAAMSTDRIQKLQGLVEELYPAWNLTKQFVREVKTRLAPTRDYFFFADIASVVEEIGELYGRWQDENDCKPLKRELLGSEDVGPAGAGRVRLADFYKRSLHDELWQFSESAAYLRQLGAIDDSDPSNVRVIIPNYVSSPANCVASSSYYMVCCVDECEALLGNIEQAFSKPELLPHDIATHVAAMPSSTVPSNRTLPAWLLSRLDELADYHSGRVPLHGRLFAQWMHYAYPRECKYPHVSGTTDPHFWAPDHPDAEATKEEMLQVIATAHIHSRAAPDDAAADAYEHVASMWTMEEELVVYRPAASTRGPPSAVGNLVRGAVFISAVVSIYVAIGHGFTVGTVGGHADMSRQKFFL